MTSDPRTVTGVKIKNAYIPTLPSAFSFFAEKEQIIFPQGFKIS